MRISRDLTNRGGYIYIKDAIGTDIRLTLDQIESKELGAEYSAIYRTSEDWNEWINEIYLKKGFSLISSGAMWPEKMRKTSDTLQYYWILHNDGE